MPQNLGGIALPFAVLGIAALHSCYLSGGNQIFKFLHAADDAGRCVLAEGHLLHDGEDILQLNFGRIELGDVTLAHGQEILVTITRLLSMSSR